MRVCLAILVLLSAGTSPSLLGQDVVKAEDQYVSLVYARVDPENRQAYEAWLRTDSAKYYQAAMNEAGSNLWGWSVARLMYSGIDEGGATHVTSLIYNGPPQTTAPSVQERIIKQVSGMESAEYLKKLNALRKVLGTELVRGVAWAGGSSPEGSFRVVTYSKVRPGKMPSMLRLIREAARPAYEAAAKDGSILAYSSWAAVFPRGTQAPYDSVYAVTYKDFASAVRGLPLSKYYKSPESYRLTTDEFLDLRQPVRIVISRIVATGQKPVTRK